MFDAAWCRTVRSREGLPGRANRAGDALGSHDGPNLAGMSWESGGNSISR